MSNAKTDIDMPETVSAVAEPRTVDGLGELRASVGGATRTDGVVADRSITDRWLRRGDRRPSVDPRGSGASAAAFALRYHDRTRLPDVVAVQLLSATAIARRECQYGRELRGKQGSVPCAGHGRGANPRTWRNPRLRRYTGRGAGDHPNHCRNRQLGQTGLCCGGAEQVDGLTVNADWTPLSILSYRPVAVSPVPASRTRRSTSRQRPGTGGEYPAFSLFAASARVASAASISSISCWARERSAA